MTYEPTPTFWLEATDTVAVGLRRYSTAERSGFTCEAGYHSSLAFIGEAPVRFDERDGRTFLAGGAPVPHDDPRWPTACRCGYQFCADDPWQDWQELLYQRADTGERVTLRGGSEEIGGPSAAAPGAMWHAWWMPDHGPDGIHLMVRCPNGNDWHVDGRASNCTLPSDNAHRCWVRHGDPRTEPVTVDKNGLTCTAGAGSILSGDYHGFLRNGILTSS